MFDHLHQLEHQRRYFKERYPRGQPPQAMEMEKEVIAEARANGGERMQTLVHRGRYKRALLRKTNKAGGNSVMDLSAVKQEMMVKSEVGGDGDGSGAAAERSPVARNEPPMRERSPLTASRSPLSHQVRYNTPY